MVAIWKFKEFLKGQNKSRRDSLNSITIDIKSKFLLDNYTLADMYCDCEEHGGIKF